MNHTSALSRHTFSGLSDRALSIQVKTDPSKKFKQLFEFP